MRQSNDRRIEAALETGVSELPAARKRFLALLGDVRPQGGSIRRSQIELAHRLSLYDFSRQEKSPASRLVFLRYPSRKSDRWCRQHGRRAPSRSRSTASNGYRARSPFSALPARLSTSYSYPLSRLSSGARSAPGWREQSSSHHCTGVGKIWDTCGPGG